MLHDKVWLPIYPSSDGSFWKPSSSSQEVEEEPEALQEMAWTGLLPFLRFLCGPLNRAFLPDPQPSPSPSPPFSSETALSGPHM